MLSRLAAYYMEHPLVVVLFILLIILLVEGALWKRR
jgi:hypothetical protein